jgi:hypothetical protein
LIIHRKTNDLGFFDSAHGGFLRGGRDKVTHTPALDFGGAFDDGERLGRDGRLSVDGSSPPLGTNDFKSLAVDVHPDQTVLQGLSHALVREW